MTRANEAQSGKHDIMFVLHLPTRDISVGEW